jgi:TPR repeat protein
MYQHGQGVEQDNVRAIAWYRLSRDQGNTEGSNNLVNLCVDLEQSGSALCKLDPPVNDPALILVQRRVRIRELRAQITGLETDALQDDVNAQELANMGKNGKPMKKNNSITRGITKTLDAVGTVAGTPARLQAPELRQEAARLRLELAQLESLDQSSTNIPLP